MTPRERVMAVLHHEKPDITPFTVYETKVPMCEAEFNLRCRGMCLVRRITSYSMWYPNVKNYAKSYVDKKGRYVTETFFETPVGTLSQIDEPAGFTTWHHERLFKTEDDYKPLLFILKDALVAPNYNYAATVDKQAGSGFVVRDAIPLEPLQKLISELMGVEEFSYQWIDNRDEIMKLYDAIVETNRKAYPIIAEGPLEFANYGGNVIPSLIGRDVFRDYFVPHYNEAAEILHKHNKLIGCHFDGANEIILNDIAATDLDYIEAYDVGMNPSLSESKKIFGDKVLWLNYPSAWHLFDCEKVKNKTIEMLSEAGDENVIIGITEDVPPERWRGNFAAIMDGIELYKSGIYGAK